MSTLNNKHCPVCDRINVPQNNVLQPAATQQSKKMSNAKRTQTGGGWRKVSLNTYKAMKKGNVPLLGSCYQKKN